MTRELLNKVASEKNVNLDWFDSVMAYFSGKRLVIVFAESQGVGIKVRLNEKTVKYNISTLIREWKQGGADYEDYPTKGWIYMSDIH